MHVLKFQAPNIKSYWDKKILDTVQLNENNEI